MRAACASTGRASRSRRIGTWDRRNRRGCQLLEGGRAGCWSLRTVVLVAVAEEEGESLRWGDSSRRRSGTPTTSTESVVEVVTVTVTRKALTKTSTRQA